MGIYDKTTGFPRLDNESKRKNEDKTVWEDVKAYRLDEERAKNRNREIEKEVDTLREQINIFAAYYSDKWEHIDVMEDRIKDLLEERDKNTFKYGLAGKSFDELYLKRAEQHKPEVTGEDTLYDKLITSGIPMSVIEETPEVTGDSRFRFITEEMVTLYSRKNTDYGDAFAQSLDEDGLLVSKIRMGDKFKRFSQLIKNDALVDDETMRDTLIDLANYTVMTLMWLDENE